MMVGVEIPKEDFDLAEELADASPSAEQQGNKQSWPNSI